MHNKLLFWGKTITLRKRKRFYGWALYYFFIFFGMVMCHEPQTWGHVVVEKMYITYFMHIDFIQSFSYNHWIKLNFDSKWALSFKMLPHILKFFFLCLRFPKNVIKILVYSHLLYLLYIIFLGEKWWKMAYS
jgi:phosphatidylserine synthase